MPIESLPPRYRELGRLKFGDDLGDRPTQLRTWRLTTSDSSLVDAAAQLFGGTAIHKPEGGSEVITETDALDVLIPPQDIAGNQWWELWTAGGLQRRCTGSAMVEHDDNEPTGWRKTGPCLCNDEPGPRACKPTTVLRVLIPQLPDLGVWRLTTRSVWAAAELPAAAEVLLRLAAGNPAPAILALDERSTKKPGQGARHFVVPVLRTTSTLGELIRSDAVRGRQPLPLEAQGDEDRTPQLDRIAAPSAPPLTEAAPGAADTRNPQKSDSGASERLRDAVATFLDDHPPATLPHIDGELVEVLTELERLMVTAGLWSDTDGSPLDAAAGKWLDGADWRAGVVMTVKLRTFAERAVMAAINDLTKPRYRSRERSEP